MIGLNAKALFHLKFNKVKQEKLNKINELSLMFHLLHQIFEQSLYKREKFFHS